MNINQTLKQYFGYDSLRTGQEELINGILDRRRKIAVLPASGAYA